MSELQLIDAHSCWLKDWFLLFPGMHLLFINIHNYITVTISSKEQFTATGFGAMSLKLYRELYNSFT